MLIEARALTCGMVIVEDKGRGRVVRIPVKTVEFSKDSCRGIHVNSSLCYERIAQVVVE